MPKIPEGIPASKRKPFDDERGITRYDLYSLERICESLTTSVDGLSESTQTAGSHLDTMNDRIEELGKAVDALTKTVEKLPEILARDQQ